MEITRCDFCGAVIKVNVGSTGPNLGVRQTGVTVCHQCADEAQDLLAGLQRSKMPEMIGDLKFKPTKVIQTVAEMDAEEEDENGDS